MENGFSFVERDIKEERPTKEELAKWYKQSGFPLKKFFNTSGMLYKEMELKDKLTNMSEDKQLELLASDGMLVKRPILITDSLILLGFKESEYKDALL